ncbi:GntR family transcriptional regulator [Trinickia sp. LjRoot230]|uniref:GntR family transcriptional regulator n=1 Tax=Trinickia sp. LjRoot230 TaxID=3342288 RepID=UPI003ECD6022
MQTRVDSTGEAIAESLRELIASGELADGMRLVERDLAERFAVSRVPLREALKKLEADGLVEIHRNRGATVCTLTPRDIQEIYDLRMLLEGNAIFRAVKRMDDETLGRATLVHRLLGKARTHAKQGELNREFHALLYAPCNNARLIEAIWGLRAQVERYERLQTTLLADTPAFQHEHAEILKACRERNARLARAATLAHLASAKRIAQQVAMQTPVPR